MNKFRKYKQGRSRKLSKDFQGSIFHCIKDNEEFFYLVSKYLLWFFETFIIE
jgi:hypothetical protein